MNFTANNLLAALAVTLLVPAMPALSAEAQQGDQEKPELLPVGTTAPDFTRKTQDGQTLTLHKLKGKQAVVLYFYPKDETRVCTAEACAFRDAYEPLKKLGAQVVGVSSDSDESHQAFARNHQLPFLLISDTDNSLKDLYKVPATKTGLHGRATYVIDKKGVIRLSFFDAKNGEEHVAQAKNILEQLSKKK